MHGKCDLTQRRKPLRLKIPQWTKNSINTLDRAAITLKALTATKDTEEYSEARYSKAREHVGASLHAFASATSKEQGSFEHFTEVRGRAHKEMLSQSLNSHVVRPAKHVVTPDEYPDLVNTNVYDTLRGYTRCHCQLTEEDTGTEHEAKLCLRSRVHVNQGLVDFDLHFWSVPHCDLQRKDRHWQQLRLHVPR